jgi:hypothetical protein
MSTRPRSSGKGNPLSVASAAPTGDNSMPATSSARSASAPMRRKVAPAGHGRRGLDRLAGLRGGARLAVVVFAARGGAAASKVAAIRAIG